MQDAQAKEPTSLHRDRRPNGAGNTTFARRYLPEDAGVVHFVNADRIAGGLSPLDPRLAAVRAGRLVLQEIDRLAAERANFAFETTLSGLGVLAGLADNSRPFIASDWMAFWTGSV